MVKIFNPYNGQDTLGATIANLGKQLFGDNTANAINSEKLYAAQRENAETDNLMKRVAQGGGAQALASDPVAQAMILGAGMKPGAFGDLGLLGAATQFGAADPRTQNFQVGTGQSFSNTADAFNAKLAEDRRSTDMASADRRYGVDQSIGQQRYEFDNKPINAIGANGQPVFAPQGQAATGGYSPVLSNTETQGTLARQNFGSMGALPANEQEYLGANISADKRTPKNYILNGQNFLTYDGVTDVRGQPLPSGGYIGNVQGGAADAGLTNSVTTDVQKNILSNNKFKNLAALTREYAQKDPNNFGIPGFIKGTVQDVAQLAGTVAQGLGYNDVETAVTSALADAQRNGVDPSLISGLYDPNLSGLHTLSDLMVYSAAEALAGQSGRSVSDKDVQFFKRIVGDPRDIFMNQQKYLTKLTQIERILDMNQATLRDAQMNGAVPNMGAGQVPPETAVPAPQAPVIEETWQRGPDGRLMRAQ